MDIWDPNWTAVKSLFSNQDQNVGYKCWVHVLMRLYLTQHGHRWGLIWLNIGNLPNTPHISKMKTVLWKYSFIVQRAIPIVDFVGFSPDLLLNLGWTILSIYTQSDGVMPLTGHLWPKLDCCANSFPVSGPNFGYSWVLDQMRLNLTEHGHWCGLIRLNIGNLHNIPHISRLKTVSWIVFLLCQKGDPNW